MKKSIAFLLAGVTAGALMFAAASAQAAPQSFVPQGEDTFYFMTTGHDGEGHHEGDEEWFGKRMSPEEREAKRAEHKAHREEMKKELMALPPEEREARMKQMREEFEAKREERGKEFRKNFEEKWNSSSAEERKGFCERAVKRCDAPQGEKRRHGGKRPGCEMIRESCGSIGGEMND